MLSRHCQIILLVSVLASLCLRSVCVGADWGEEGWATRVAEIKAATKEKVYAGITEKSVAAQYGVAWPAAHPQHSLDELKAQARRELARQAEADVPAPDLAAAREELVQKTQPWEVGDKVKFDIPGRGPNPRVEGMITKITPQLIRVGQRWLRPSELPENVRVRFFPTDSKAYIRGRLQALVSACDRARALHVAERFDAHFGGLAAADGYVKVKNVWCPARSLVTRVTAIKQEKALPGAIDAALKAAGFTWFRGEWQPKRVADAILGREAEERRRLDAELARRREQERQRELRTKRGKVFRVVSDDLLLVDRENDTIAIEVDTGPYVDGDPVAIEAEVSGTYSFTSVEGVPRKVRKYKALAPAKAGRPLQSTGQPGANRR